MYLKMIILAFQMILIVISLIALVPLAYPQSNRRIQISQSKTPANPMGRYYALLVAVSDFAPNSGINSLDHPLQDAERVQQVLTTQYTFDSANVTLLRNPNRAAIIRALDDLSHKLTEQDNLLIFYAGHGYWDARINQGFWFPSDARQDDRAEWLSNSTLRDYISGIRTKHTLLVADACFSGGIFKTRAAFEAAPRPVEALYKLASRNAMTSGGMAEVPDKSVFVAYFLKRLSENRQNYLTAQTLFSSMRKAVTNNSPNAQIPQYGEIREVGDEGGDFIFVRRGESANAVAESPERLATTLYLQDKFVESEAAYRQAIEREPNNPKLHNMLGTVLKEQKKLKAAEDAYEKAAKLESKAEWYADLGEILLLQKKYGKAETQFRRALQLAPNNAKMYENLGKTLYASAKLAEAVTTLQKAIALAPDASRSHYYLGLTLLSQKKYVEAEAELRAVLRINPQDTQAKQALDSLAKIK
jgi:tetratricopeptide (TPR) repeat protein